VILVTKFEGYRLLGKPVSRWEDNIQMSFKHTGCERWTGSGKGEVAGSCEHDNETLGSIKSRMFLDQLGDSHLIKKDCFVGFVAFYVMIHEYEFHSVKVKIMIIQWKGSK
jgi:hypothetical protein